MKNRILTKFISIGVGLGLLLLFPTNQHKFANAIENPSFGWKYPTANFPSTGIVSNSYAYSDIRDPGGVPRGLPIRLKIPIINVDSAIEDAYITSDGKMDVPAGSVNVAWFALGPHPGQEGSAVIGGHYGMDNNIPKVFYKLDNLKVGDTIYIIDDKNDTLAFVVRKTKLFNRNDDATTVFTSNDGLSHLNLITCDGVWNEVNDTYPLRLVIFTDAITTEEIVNIEPKLTTNLTPIPSDVPILVTEEKDANNFQKVTTYLKSLYDDPVDGTISSLLIISIIFIVILIFK